MDVFELTCTKSFIKPLPISNIQAQLNTLNTCKGLYREHEWYIFIFPNSRAQYHALDIFRGPLSLTVNG
ncbi:hypothetical protein E1A91_D03G027500v1 [Gossypium mustelinum]|uniref:Uncharacterized protein n=1 Tax=Gossypium mustelinum TaxID=34275 RepID=A0A5D2VIM0_GOSMU|nr:hypothetical protein E1A91_D03G027500v1 [Gossypium mustelinum]